MTTRHTDRARSAGSAPSSTPGHRSAPPARPRARHRVGLAAIVLSLACAWMLASAGPAAAHAVPVSSTPSDRSHVDQAPAAVSVTFSEPVTSEVGGLSVLNRSGDRVDQGSTTQPSPTAIATELQPDLPSGTYIANYKVISADGHPVSGSIVFAVGDATLDASAANTLASSTDTAMDALAKVGQFLTYAGVLLAAGLAFFLQFIHDGSPDRPDATNAPERKRLGRVVVAAVAAGVVGIVVSLVAQAALATGTGLGAIFDATTLRGVLKQGLGWQDAGLLVGLALCLVSVTLRHKVAAQACAFYGGLVATASFVLWGHATESSQPWLIIPANITHVVAGAVWFGGLVGVAVFLRTRIGRLDLSPASPGPGVVSGDPALLRADPLGASGRRDGAVLVDDPPRAGITTGPVGGASSGGADEGDRDGPRGELRSTVAVVRRFSTVAAGSLIVLAIAGVALGWAETGSLAGLTTTTYGRLLLAKVAVVAIIAFIAGYNRFFLLPWLFQDVDDDPATATADATGLAAAPVGAAAATASTTSFPSVDPGAPLESVESVSTDEPAPADDPDELRAGWRSLLNTVRIEALLIVVVLAITAVLTNTPPGTATVDTEIFQESQPFRGGQVTLTITPDAAGPNVFHADITDASGKPNDSFRKVTAEMTMAEKGIGPITREMIKAGPGHYILDQNNDLAVPGEWQIVLIIRVSDFDQERVTFVDSVR